MTSAPAKKSTATKTAKPVAKPAANVAPKPVPKPAPVAVDAKVSKTLRAKDLIARVAESTGAKVKDIRATVEATLSELGKALDAGDALNLPPLGKIKITPAKTEGSTQPMKLKLRRGGTAGGGGRAAKEALADAGEDS